MMFLKVQIDYDTIIIYHSFSANKIFREINLRLTIWMAEKDFISMWN